MSLSFADLRNANSARQKEWDPDDRITLAYRGNELGGECGEAQNVIKKIERERLGIRGTRATIDDLADELADLIICADLIAMQEGFDLDQSVWRKFNETSRKYNLATRLDQSAPPDPSRIRNEQLRALIEKAREIGFTEEAMAEQRKSWVIGELMLADPTLSYSRAEDRYQQAIGGR